MENNKAFRVLEYNKMLEKMTEYTSSTYVKNKILQLTPTDNLEQARTLQAETAEAVSLSIRFGNPQSLAVANILGALKRAEIGSANSPRDLLEILNLLRVTRMTKSYIAHDTTDNVPILTSMATLLGTNKKLEDEIFNAIISEDEISDSASPALYNIRRKIRSLQDKIKEILNNMLRSTKYQKYLQDPIITMRGDRYVLPVRAEYKSEVSGISHDSSSSGATVFIEPIAVVNANNDIRNLMGDEQEEIEKILMEFTVKVDEISDTLRMDFEQISELDFIFSRAKLAVAQNATCPTLNDRGYVYLKNARHPLIAKSDVVANNIYIGNEFDSLIITGPNTGGKTVSLKTLGLFALMAAAGMHIPANDGSEVAIFDNVFADIGDEQSIEQSLSTFSSHMINIVNILSEITPNSLILFDELGAGTDPTEGAALAVSILEFTRAMGSKVAATTHYSELKMYALSTERVTNASCEFDIKSLRPTYKLLIGVPGKSNAFAISKRLGLMDSVIDRARAIISEEAIRFEDVISDLEITKREVENEKNRASILRRDADALKEENSAQKDKLNAQKQKIIEDARREARRIISNAKDESSTIIKDLENLKKIVMTNANIDGEIAKAREVLSSKEKKLDAQMTNAVLGRRSGKVPKNLKVGDIVEILTLADQKATVLSLPDTSGNIELQAGIMKISSNIKNLKLVNGQKEKLAAHNVFEKRQYEGRNVNRSIGMEFDVRGQMVEEAIDNVDKFLDDAKMAGLLTVQIIHGKGTGALRNAIQQFLRKHPHVRTYRSGVYGEGENGVTIIEIK